MVKKVAKASRSKLRGKRWRETNLQYCPLPIIRSTWICVSLLWSRPGHHWIIYIVDIKASIFPLASDGHPEMTTRKTTRLQIPCDEESETIVGILTQLEPDKAASHARGIALVLVIRCMSMMSVTLHIAQILHGSMG